MISAHAIESGTYKCIDGNEASICPQILRTIVQDAKVVGLRIYYSGYCNDQGPYMYDCYEDGTCGDGSIEFSQFTDSSYHWENQPQGFFCDFTKE